MVDDEAHNRAGNADHRDKAVRQLIAPEVLTTLDRTPPLDIRTTAFWVGRTPVAATCARIDRVGASAELLSMACLPQFTDTEVTAWALQELRSSVEAEGTGLAFDPTAPITDAARRTLIGAGLHPADEWVWFDSTPETESIARTLWVGPLPAHTTLAGLNPSELQRLMRISDGRLAPTDRLDISPVVLDRNSEPIGYFLLRAGGNNEIYGQWAWVSPKSRGRRVLAAVALVMFDRFRRAGLPLRLRFRVLDRNQPMLSVLREAGAGSVQELWTTSSWRTVARGSDEAAHVRDDLQ